MRYSADLNGGFGKVYAHDGDPRPLPTSLIDQTAMLVGDFDFRVSCLVRKGKNPREFELENVKSSSAASA